MEIVPINDEASKNFESLMRYGGCKEAVARDVHEAHQAEAESLPGRLLRSIRLEQQSKFCILCISIALSMKTDPNSDLYM